MKKKNTRPLVSACAFTLLLPFVLSLTGCRQPSLSSDSGKNAAGSSFRKKSQLQHAVPLNPHQLAETDVLATFDLQRGNITASAAAKKIATDTPASGITFTERNFIAYDDQTCMFTVKIIG